MIVFTVFGTNLSGVEEKGCLVGKKMDLVKVRVAKNYRPLTPIPHPHNFFADTVKTARYCYG